MNSLYNRELSWLTFNRRVLQEAEDRSVPLIQRLRFLGIYSNNNDEFIKVRFANLVRMRQSCKTKSAPLMAGGFTASELVDLIDQEVSKIQATFSAIYEQLLKEMAEEGIRIIDETMLNEEQERFCRDYFLEVVSRRVVPLFLRKAERIPFLPDAEIYLAVHMGHKKAGKKRFALIQIPVDSACPRFVRLPSGEGKYDLILLDDIIRLCLDDIFFMFTYDKIRAFTFKLVRDASLNLENGPYKSLLEKMERGLEERIHGKPVRLIYDQDMPDDLLRMLVSKLRLGSSALEPGRRYHMMRDLMQFPAIRPELEAERKISVQHPDIKPFSSIFKRIDQQDILLAFPYQSFNHVIDFLREAAITPKVESIHITLYRLAKDSKVVTALVSAAKNGKKVVAYVELLARFDEQHNADVIDMLQEAGIQVIHNSPTLKIHSKLILVQYKEQRGRKTGYVYIGTGNFNENTAKIYSDFGLLTTKKSFVDDAKSLFAFLSNMHNHFSYKEFLIAPYSLRKSIIKLIEKEISNAEIGKKSYIWIKCNNITDEKISHLLYKASQKGVDIRLIVRSSCCIKPQQRGLSENIRAISIVDGYLEHARIMIFGNNGNATVYISSADLMTRNLDRRVEVAAPILDNDIKKEVLHFFEIQWSDNVKARDLAFLGSNKYVVADGAIPVRAQTAIYEYYANRAL
jgi:polyphosphate kinase